MHSLLALVFRLVLATGHVAPVDARTADPVATAVHDLRGIPADPGPDALINDRHYLVSNERRLDLFVEHVRDRRGVHVGVGTDPNYVLAAWAKAELMVLVDFDQAVVDLHAVYAALLAASPDGETFEALWNEENVERARSILMDAPTRGASGEALWTAYQEARPLVARRLAILHAKLALASTPWFLNDPDQFAHLRELARRGRIVALRGDFTRDGVVHAVGEVLERSRLRVSVLYLSNIEQYFMYRAPYRDNMRNLPWAPDGVVLRTLPGRPAGFEYIVQTADNFTAWLADRRTWSVYTMRALGKGERLVPGTRHVIDAWPPRR